MELKADILSIGHSTLTREAFGAILDSAGVTAVADVRSWPFSRFSPHFSQHELKFWLAQDGFSYVFMGRELGGRPEDPSLFHDGVADYEAMAHTSIFEAGVNRLIEGAKRHLIALMCSEKDPLDCHRCLLVSRRLAERGMRIGHIMPDAAIIPHAETEERLLQLERKASEDFFASRAERLAGAYRARGRKVAFAEPTQAAG
jgi:uncharacterized protein (DUF488 family)